MSRDSSLETLLRLSGLMSFDTIVDIIEEGAKRYKSGERKDEAKLFLSSACVMFVQKCQDATPEEVIDKIEMIKSMLDLTTPKAN